MFKKFRRKYFVKEVKFQTNSQSISSRLLFVVQSIHNQLAVDYYSLLSQQSLLNRQSLISDIDINCTQSRSTNSD